MTNYYRVYANIDMDCIIANYRAIKAHVGSSEVMIMIKADGYGHGAIPIARELVDEGVDGIGVATIHEAMDLRVIDKHTPILILGYTHTEMLQTLIENDITQTVYSLNMAKELSKKAVELNQVAKIHIKIDTGMGRIGFLLSQEAINDIKEISVLPGIKIEGIFTHFSKADETDQSYTNNQIKAFEEFINRLEQVGIYIPLKHASNSAGVFEFNEAHYGLVRVGIALYGLYPSKEVAKKKIKLKPALSLMSRVIFVKTVEKGTKISYGGIYTTKGKSVIATIPVGYGDGYPRALSSKGRVLIRGQYAPIVGRVCMDQFMVDVTHIEGVSDGDEVVLIGKQGENEIPVEEIADIVGTINYEIVCQLGKRIPRSYYRDQQLLYTRDYF